MISLQIDILIKLNFELKIKDVKFPLDEYYFLISWKFWNLLRKIHILAPAWPRHKIRYHISKTHLLNTYYMILVQHHCDTLISE